MCCVQQEAELNRMAHIGVGVHSSIHTPVRWVLGAQVTDSSLTSHVDIPTSISLDHSSLSRHSIFCIEKSMVEDTACILGISPLLFFVHILFKPENMK